MVSNTSRKDYFVGQALEMTPHPNRRLVSVLDQPIMKNLYKYTVLETTASGSNATSATPSSLINLNQGTTDITRIGDRIRVKRLWITGKIVGNAASAGAVASRVLVVLWNPVGVGSLNSPVSGQVVQGASPYLPYAAYSRDYGDSYQVVYDGLFEALPASTANPVHFFHLDREITVDMEFSAGAAVPTTNCLYCFFLTDTVANQPSVQYQSTVWFEDCDA